MSALFFEMAIVTLAACKLQQLAPMLNNERGRGSGRMQCDLPATHQQVVDAESENQDNP